MSTSDRNHGTRILAWNVNHRASKRRIPDWVASSILATSPDIVVLTEYVEGDDHAEFLKALRSGGLAGVLLTAKTNGENQVLIASREAFDEGELRAPPIYSSVPLNALHIKFQGTGLNVLGFRMPSGKQFDVQFRRPTWDWLIEAAAHLRDKPSLVIGDFNTAPGDSASKCGDYIDRMLRMGWIHRPESGCSYRHSSGSERQIDHCFASPKVNVLHAEYRWDFHAAAPDAASGKVGIPDHAMLVVDLDCRTRAQRSQELGGEMCTVGKDGKLSNGEIMLEMLGDEPDVSHTSLAWAKQLGLSEGLQKMLGKKDNPSSPEPKDPSSTADK